MLLENDEGGVMKISAGYKGNMTEETSNRNPPERYPCPMDSQGPTQEGHTIPHHDQRGDLQDCTTIKQEIKEEVMDDQPPLTSPDGSNNRNPPERYPRPLDSQDPTQEGHTIPHHDRRGDLQDCTTIKQEIKVEEMEDQPPLTSPDGSSNRNPPQRCPRPLDSQDSTQEGHTIPHHDQSELLPGIKVEDVKNEEDPMVYQPCTAEEIPLEISTDGRYIEKPSEQRSFLHSESEEEDDVTDESSEENSIPTNHGHHSMDRVSTGERTFSCKFCGKFFTQKATLTEHLMIHTGERPFPCPECNKSFSRKSVLVIHLRTHSQEKLYRCPECGKGFGHKWTLERHLKIHTEEKPFSCSECGKCFPMKSDLARHMNAHSDLKRYSCPECGKGFKFRSNLQKHRLHIHRNLKRYTCTTCGKLFGEKGQLARHQNVHRDVKPLLCTSCGKTFVRKASLKNHQKIPSC